MTSKHEQFTLYLEKEIEHSNLQQKKLQADERADEAVFAKIRMNVFDIFRSVFSVAAKTYGEDEEKIRIFFLSRTEQIPQNWHLSLQKAKEHNDVEKIHIETIKLETLAEIKATFEKIWENTL